MSINDFAGDVKVAWVAALGTMGSGFGAAMDVIPEDIGKLATLFGMVLSMVLIYAHVQNVRLTRLRIAAEIAKAAK